MPRPVDHPALQTIKDLPPLLLEIKPWRDTHLARPFKQHPLIPLDKIAQSKAALLQRPVRRHDLPPQKQSRHLRPGQALDGEALRVREGHLHVVVDLARAVVVDAEAVFDIVGRRVDRQAGVAGATGEGVDGHVQGVVFGVQGQGDEGFAQVAGPGLEFGEFALQQELFERVGGEDELAEVFARAAEAEQGGWVEQVQDEKADLEWEIQ